MKKSFFALISLTAPLFAATETVFLKVPADIKVLPWESRLHHTEKSEFDKTMNRDVVKINYSLPPGTNKNTLFSISFPELQNAKWQSIDSLKLTYRGGFGHIAIGIVDKDGEHFVSKKTTVLGAEKWSTHTSSYTDASLKACHQWGGGKKKNGVMDPPLKITSLRIVIYPSYIASQLRGAPILTSTKPTPDEIRRGMNPVDLYLASLEVNGVRYGVIQPEAVKKTSRVNVEFLEIGTTAPLRKGNRKILRYCLNNPSGSAVSAKVSAKAQLALTNAQQTYSETIPLKAGEQKIISLPFHFQENGFYNVNLTLSENGGTATAKTFVSVWDPVGNDWQDSPETFFGTQCILDLFEKEFGKYREQDYKNMRNAGVKLVRFVLRWKFVQPQKNGPLHWEIYDKIFRQLKKHGFIGYPMISNAPNWAAVPAAEKDKPAFVMSCAPDNKLYAEFAAKVAERYKDYTCYFQIWNEPYAHHYYWGGSPETYADMLKESYSAIKKVNPNAKICAGAAWDEVFFKAKGCYDFWPLHCHSGVETLHSVINRHRKMAGGDTADMAVFWNDETGFSVDPFADGSEIRKASEIARKAILSRAEGLSAHVWFIYRGAPNASANPRDNFPAVDEKNRCRPVVIAHNNMVRHIRQSKIAGKYYRPGSGEAYLFRQKDKQILIFWRSDIPKGQMISMIFDSPFSGSLSNLFGSETVYASQGRTATMMLTEEPQYLTLPENVNLRDIRFTSLLEMPYRFIRKKGDTKQPVTFSVTNPSGTNLKGTFRFFPADGWTPQTKELALNLPAGKTKRCSIFFTAKAPASIAHPRFEFRSENNRIAINGILKFITCSSLGRNWTLLAGPNRKEDTVSLRTGDVDADMFWQGAKDLSARIFAKWDEKFLCLKTEVQDNIHHQIRKGTAIYDGDSLQIAIRGTDVNLQFGIARTNSGEQIFHQWKGNFSKIPDFSVVRERTRTVYEIRIPWQELNLTGRPGTVFELSELVNDNDGRARKVLLEWGGGIHGMTGKPMNPLILE